MWAATIIMEQLGGVFSSEPHRWLQADSSNSNSNSNNDTISTTTMDMDGATNSSSSSSSNSTTESMDSDDGSSSSDIISILSIVFSNIFLFFLIFGMSATVDVKHMKQQLTNRFAIGTGVTMQFLFMPVLGFAAVMLLRNNPGMTRPMELLLLVVTSSPGGSYSNWWCSLFNAELALSVAMTSVSSILSIGLLPLNLFIYTWLTYDVFGQAEDDIAGQPNVLESLDFGAIFISLGIVMTAIVSGLFAGYVWDNDTFHSRINHFGSLCGLLLILISVFLSSGADGADVNIWSLPWAFYVGTAFPCVLGMTLANIGARMLGLTKPECVAISIECCYQNTAIGTSVAVTMFSNPNERAEAVSVPLFYGVCEAVLIGVYCVWAWKMGWTKAPPDENICVVMYKSYEVGQHDDDDKDEDENNTDAEGAGAEGAGAGELPDDRDRGKVEDDVEVAQNKHTTKEAAAAAAAEEDRLTDQTTSTGTDVTAINGVTEDGEKKEAAPDIDDSKEDDVVDEEQVLEAAGMEVELADYDDKKQ